MPSLAETQRQFFRALQFPLRGTSRRATDLPESDEPHDPKFLATADALLRPSPMLIPAECLELYHRQYWFRLLDSIEEDFPGLIRLIGKDTYWKFIEEYMQTHASQSYTLRHLGRLMPEFLEKHILDPVTRQRATSVAAIEWAMMACFEASDSVTTTPEQVAEELFTLKADIQLLELPSAASAWLDDPDVAWLYEADGPFHVVIWRSRNGSLHHRSLDPGEYSMLQRLHSSVRTLDEWLAASASDIPDPDTLTRWFARWQADEFLSTPNQTNL